MWMAAVDQTVSLVIRQIQAEPFGASKRLRARCPKITQVDIPDFTLWSRRTNSLTGDWGIGRQIRFFESYAEEVSGLAGNVDLEDSWMI